MTESTPGKPVQPGGSGPRARPGAGHFPRGLGALLIGLLALFSLTAGADEPSREERIKAAIVYKVGKFVDWPQTVFSDPGTPLSVCQFGEDPFARALSGIAGRIVQGRVVRFRIVDQPLAAVLRQCHILYFPGPSVARVSAVLREVRGQPVLTISDIPNFAQLGGMITLVRAGDRLGFEIAPGVASGAGLRVHAQLLDLADIVGGGREDGE